jgi:hypothetical protein
LHETKFLQFLYLATTNTENKNKSIIQTNKQTNKQTKI